MRSLMLLALSLLALPSRAIEVSGTCSGDAVAIACPQTIGAGSTVTWTGENSYVRTVAASAVGASTYSLVTSSGLKVLEGGLTFPDGSTLTTVPADDSATIAALSASTAALSASTVTLSEVKASSGVNADITSLESLVTVTPALTVVSSLTVQGDLQVSPTGNIRGQTTNSQLTLNNSVGASLYYSSVNGLPFVSDSNGAHIGTRLTISGATGETNLTGATGVDASLTSSSMTAKSQGADGFSIKASSSIRLDDGGLRFADGTTQYTAATGGVDPAVIASLSDSTAALSASTVSLQGQVDALSLSTASNAGEIASLSASTAALSASTVTLSQVKASTGTNGDISSMVGLTGIVSVTSGVGTKLTLRGGTTSGGSTDTSDMLLVVDGSGRGSVRFFSGLSAAPIVGLFDRFGNLGVGIGATDATANIDAGSTIRARSYFISGDGTQSLPGYNFSSESNTGLFRSGTGRLGVSAAGVHVATFSASGITTSYGVTAATGEFTATGDTLYSVQASSSIRIDAGGLRFADGSVQYAAAAGGGGGVEVSSSVIVAGQTVSVNDWLTAVPAIATATLTTNGGTVYANASLIMANCAEPSNCNACFSLLIDGVRYQTSTNFGARVLACTSFSNFNGAAGVSFRIPIEGVGAGSHSFALLAADFAGFPYDILSDGDDWQSVFFVEEPPQ